MEAIVALAGWVNNQAAAPLLVSRELRAAASKLPGWGCGRLFRWLLVLLPAPPTLPLDCLL